jgi:hypothetical protein
MICLGGASSVPSRAAAQPLPIEWHAPSGCPSLADVSSWLEAVVPAELRTRLAGITAEVSITRVEGRFHAAIRVTHGSWSGEREVDGRRCEEVARSAIVVVSVSLAEAVEVIATQPTITPVIPPIADPPADPPVEEAHHVPTEPPPAEPLPPVVEDAPRYVLDVGAGVAFGFGTRAVTSRFDLAAHRSLHPSFTLGVRARAMPRARVEREAANATIAYVTVGVEGCGRHSPTSMFHVVGCVRLDVGTLIASGEDVENAQRGRAPVVDFALFPGIEVGKDVRIRLSAEIESRLVRPQLTVDGIGTVYRARRVGGSIDLRLVILIP